MSHPSPERALHVRLRRAALAVELAALATLVLAACQASLALDDYSFTAAGGGGSAGSASGAGTGGDATAGTGGTAGGGGGSGGAGQGGTSDTGGTGVDAPDATTPPVCVPGAELAAPALLGPARGAYSGSQHALAARATLRPRLSWAPVASECAITYRVQMDNSCARGALPSCAFDTPEVDVTDVVDTAFSPAQDLSVSLAPPVGDLFAWRVSACESNTNCSPWSEVRYLEVGRVFADLDGDAYADVAVADSPSNQVLVTGSGTFNDGYYANLPDDMFSLRWLGDVNGDGFGDLGGLGSNSTMSGTAGKVLFGSGSASGTPIRVTGSEGTSSTSPVFGPLGDINGDGFADVIVHLNNHSTADVYFGASDFTGAVPTFTIPAPLDNIYSLPSSGPVGDINGDGYTDAVLVTTPFLDAAQVLYGGATPSATLSQPIALGGACPGASISAGGDLDADGFGDFVVVCPGFGVFVRFGGAALANGWSATRLATNVASGFGDFDLDADGTADLMIVLASGAPWVFRGGAGFNLDTPEPGALPTVTLTERITAADVNGDGVIDLIVNSDNVQWTPGPSSLSPTFANVLYSTSPIPGNLGY
jgi:VCBS repeat protein/FG-GAP repeat protein